MIIKSVYSWKIEKYEPKFILFVSRESLVLLELLVHLDIRELVACPESVEVLVLLDPRERR